MTMPVGGRVTGTALAATLLIVAGCTAGSAGAPRGPQATMTAPLSGFSTAPSAPPSAAEPQPTLALPAHGLIAMDVSYDANGDT